MGSNLIAIYRIMTTDPSADLRRQILSRGQVGEIQNDWRSEKSIIWRWLKTFHWTSWQGAVYLLYVKAWGKKDFKMVEAENSKGQRSKQVWSPEDFYLIYRPCSW